MVFYDSEGIPVVYTNDSEHLHLFDGSAVGYFHNGSIYSYTGIHLGFLIKGWVVDQEGNCVFFTTTATGGPIHPDKQRVPRKHTKEFRPRKEFREYPPEKPDIKSEWSELSGIDFFARIFTS